MTTAITLSRINLVYKNKNEAIALRIPGGFTPRIAGRPLSIVEQISVPDKMFIALEQNGLLYKALIKNEQKVQFGNPLAEVEIPGGKLYLPATVTGIASLAKDIKQIIIKTTDSEVKNNIFEVMKPQNITKNKIRENLSKSGIWPFFWSSATKGIPSLDPSEQPKAIIVNSLLAEPFRARGKVILRHNWSRIVEGLKYLPRLLADYGKVEIVLTNKRDPVAVNMYDDLAGHAWVRFHPTKLKYPIENPFLLSKIFRKDNRYLSKKDTIWVIDIQGVEAIGRCLAEGVPLHRRIIALGGPGNPNPKHISARIGTPVKHIIMKKINDKDVSILRGGILTGYPIDFNNDSVNYTDDALFFLPNLKKREFLSFLRPGFTKTSYSSCFISKITRAYDSNITSTFRGEKRPCIACGLCEKICPVNMMPQVLHRYLYDEGLDEAEKTGLNLCIFCRLCTYVCPSKINLDYQFKTAIEQIDAEKLESQESDK